MAGWVYPREPLTVGIVGCGTIGSACARWLARREVGLVLVALWDLDQEKARRLAEEVGGRVEVTPPRELVERCEVVVEAASQQAVMPLVNACLPAGRTLVVMSVGGLVDLVGEGESPRRALARLDQYPGRLIVPSGAVGGLDLIRAMAEAGIERVVLTTRKPPRSLGREDREPVVVFEGDARRAVGELPKNINVAATVALAGVGFESTLVRVISDPGVSRNTHEIEVEGQSGRLVVRAENLPDPENPRTSRNAYLSLIATLRRLASTAVVGS